MPDRRLEKARRSLPDGYQFGDARDPYWWMTARLSSKEDLDHRVSMAERLGWNLADRQPAHLHSWVIEGEQHGDEWAV